MKRLLVLAFILAPTFAHAARDAGREFGVFFGGGLSRQFSKIEQPSVDAKLNGWSNFAEVGIDLPFTDHIGFSPSIEVGESELLNTYRSETYLDQTTMHSQSARGLFYYNGFELGGSYRKLKFDLRTVSSSTGSSSASVSGNGTSGFVGYSFTYRGVLRAGAQLEVTQFSNDNFKYTDTSVGLRLHLLLGGILGR